MTIRRRLLLILLGPLTLLLAIGLVFDYSAAAPPLRAAFDKALANEAYALGAQLRGQPDGTLRFDLPAQAIDMLRADTEDHVYYVVLGPNREFLGGDAGLQAAAGAGPDNPVLRDAVYASEPVRTATYRVVTSAGAATVTVAETTRKRESARRGMLIGIVLNDVAQLAAILALVWLGVRIGLKPLLALRAQIDSRSARDLAALDDRGVPGEVRPLTGALNRLFATVQATSQGQLQFLANAAHQLRTPLAGLQSQMELMIADPAAAALRPRLVSLLASTRRLGHTANQLLTLARAEPSAAVAADFQALDLRDLAEEAVSRHFDAAVRRRIDLGVEAESAGVVGSAWLLGELLANLVDNALAYTPGEGRVTVRSGRDDGGAPFLEVEDDGPGIAPEQRARVAERFYRAPGSSGEGCGLGLAIVDEIARGHHAHLHIGDAVGERGTRVRITFPAAA